MTRKQKINGIFRELSSVIPEPATELKYENHFQLLVAVILSAQCTDKRVNLITPWLFKKFPTARAMAESKREDVFELIKSCTYPNNKAANLIGMAKTVTEHYNGNIPETVDELKKLPGVGQKTANVIASVLFGKDVIAVDTHVFRVAARTGLSQNSKTPMETEKQLMKNIPAKYIKNAHHWLILHGRYVCRARNPLCSECKINIFCEYFIKGTSINKTV